MTLSFSDDLSGSMVQLVFPQRICLACGSPVSQPGICDACAQKAISMPRCRHCAAFVLDENELCPSCLDGHNHYFTFARAVYPYEDRMRDWIQAFKYYNKTYLRRPFAAMLFDGYQLYFADKEIDLIVPVPLSSGRLKERGYNQSALCAQLLAKRLKIPYTEKGLLRVKETVALAELSAKERRSCLRDAFSTSWTGLQGKTVLLIDDIFTTGATASTCAKELLDQGAKTIYVLTITAVVI